MRSRGKPDGNQEQIVKELRQVGYSVAVLSSLGRGIPDLLVGKWGISLPVEIKMPGERMNPAEAKWFESWHGSAIIAETSEEIIKTLEGMMKK